MIRLHLAGSTWLACFANMSHPACQTVCIGTTNATVANANHTHRGVGSFGKFGDATLLYGAVKLEAGTNVTITPDIPGNKLTIQSSGAGVGFQEVPAGVVNGTNATFGPFTYVPSNNDSIIVFRDGLVVNDSEWSISGLNVVFSVAPSLGQSVYVFYLTQGTVSPPPVVTGILKTEYRTISAGEATAKQLTLAFTPAVPSEVLVDPKGGGAQFYSDDFTVSVNILDWSGLGMDSFPIVAGDKLRITYVY